MGSNYFGEGNIMGSELRGSGGSSSSSNNSSPSNSSRKGKKNSSEKQPKQPQRGLGVAQLEKIRLHAQFDSPYPPPPNFPSTHFPHQLEDPTIRVQSSSSSFSYSSSSPNHSYCFHPNNITVMGLPEYERTNIRYANSHPSNTPRWDNANSILHTQSSANVTRPFLNLYDSQNIDSRKHRSGGVSNSKNSESSDTQEPDLELRLSL